MLEYWVFCILFSGISMIMDLKWEKVFNFWIYGGWIAGFVLRLVFYEPVDWISVLFGMLIPVLLLFPMFICRMLGTGDIKLLAVLGSVVGGEMVLGILLWTFVIGAGMALPILVFRCKLWDRLCYFWNYLEHVIRFHTFPAYLAPGRRPENIHFTIPIFCSVVLLALRTGGVL